MALRPVLLSHLTDGKKLRLREFECLPEVVVRSRAGTEAKSVAIMSIQSHYVILFWENSEIFLISIKII